MMASVFADHEQRRVGLAREAWSHIVGEERLATGHLRASNFGLLPSLMSELEPPHGVDLHATPRRPGQQPVGRKFPIPTRDLRLFTRGIVGKAAGSKSASRSVFGRRAGRGRVNADLMRPSIIVHPLQAVASFFGAFAREAGFAALGKRNAQHGIGAAAQAMRCKAAPGYPRPPDETLGVAHRMQHAASRQSGGSHTYPVAVVTASGVAAGVGIALCLQRSATEVENVARRMDRLASAPGRSNP